MDWDFTVSLFAGMRHPGARYNEMVYRVSLKGTATASIELQTTRVRMIKGEISRVELIDHRPGSKLSCVDVNINNIDPLIKTLNGS